MIVVGGLRGRLIFDSIFVTLQSGLTALGWINGDGPRHHQPVTLVMEQQDVYTEVPINTMALTDENVVSDPWEIGSVLSEDTRYYYIDFFGESDAVSKHIIGDVRDLLLGKMPDIGPTGPEIKVYDYRVKPNPPKLFSVEIMNVRVDRSHEMGRPWLRHWYSIQFQAIDYYNTNADADPAQVVFGEVDMQAQADA